ncbi:MAG: hypothetical protein RR385_04805 [Clostridiales bacterium]
MTYILAKKITKSWLIFTRAVFINGEPLCSATALLSRNVAAFPHSNVATFPHNSAATFPQSNVAALPYSNAKVFPHSNDGISPYKYGWRVGVAGKIPNISYLLQKIGCDNYGK